MIPRCMRHILATAAFASVFPAVALSADIAAPEPADGWTFTAALYGWAAGLDGEVAAFEQKPVEVDLSFSDILQNLDFAAMGLAEARNGPFMFGMDVAYVKIGADSNVQLDADTSVDLDVTATTWMVTGYGGYTLFDDDAVRLDLVAGARFWSVNTEFDTSSDDPAFDNLSGDDGESWVDPVTGVKMRLDVTDNVFISGWGLVGGFGVGSEFMWDAMAGAGYAFNDHFDLFAGYRAVSVDYSNDGFIYDVVEQGPVIAGVLKF